MVEHISELSHVATISNAFKKFALLIKKWSYISICTSITLWFVQEVGISMKFCDWEMHRLTDNGEVIPKTLLVSATLNNNFFSLPTLPFGQNLFENRIWENIDKIIPDVTHFNVRILLRYILKSLLFQQRWLCSKSDFLVFRVRWSRGSTFNWRSRGLWFKSYTGLTGISLGTRN